MSKYLDIIKSENFTEIKAIFENNKPEFDYSPEQALKEFNVDDHDVMNPDERKDKIIYKPVIDERTGEAKMNESTGKPEVTVTSVKVNRVPLPFQEIIVNRRVAFMLGNPVTYDVVFNEDNKKEKALVDFVYQIEDDSKTLYKNKELARRMMSEMEVAELWYLVELKDHGSWNYISQKIGIPKPKFQLKMKVLSPALKDKLYPLFDEYGDMVAFARGYELKDEKGKSVEHFDVYTAEMTYKYVNLKEGWRIDETAINGGKIPNLVEKIPLVYYPQKKPEWAKVQGMIARIEKLLSNHSEMNDYFGEPILAIFGELIQAIGKGESGKIMQLSENAKASFLALESPPESIKMEVENLEKFIYAMSQTPNIAFSEMKSLGDLSGVALELMFLDAHLAARAKEETFGVGIQRRVNLLKAFIGNVLNVGLSEAASSVMFKPVFTPYMPKNLKEAIEAISTAVMGRILSKETGSEKLEDIGFIPDAAQEKDRLLEQSNSEENIFRLQNFGQQ